MHKLCGRAARITLIIFLICVTFACAKKSITHVEPPEQPPIRQDEPIQTLSRDAAEKVQHFLQNPSTVEVQIENHNILPSKAFAYFENAFLAHLATHKISKGSSEWKLKGDLSKQMERLTFSFSVLKNEDEIGRDVASIPFDERLQNTLAQFQEPEMVHDHSMHTEMPVPTPLAELQEIPLDVAELCEGQDCRLLLLYSNRLVARNWQTGSEQTIPIKNTAQRSRAPSGKILITGDSILISSNNLASPLFLDRKFNPSKGTIPALFPHAEPGRDTYLLSDGVFYDFEKLGSGGLAVIDNKYHLEIADQGRHIEAQERVGGTLCVSLPYIYASSAALPNAWKDSILKFHYQNDTLTLVDTRNFDGAIYDIAITDLNRDQQPEMLITLRNQRGIFIEVHEPF